MSIENAFRQYSMNIDIDVRFMPDVLKTYLERHGHSVGEQALTTEDDLHAYREASGCDRIFIGCPDLTAVNHADDLYELASACNQQMAQIAERSHNKIFCFAFVPLHDITKAQQTLALCLDQWHMAGIMLAGNSNGRFLGDAALDPVMQSLQQRKASVMVVAALHPNTAQTGLTQPECLVERPSDTTRAALNLVLSGTLEQYPAIRWILAEGGGFLPYISWRVSLANAMAEYRSTIPAGMMNYLRRFYFVSTQAHTDFQLSSIVALAGAEHLLYGSGMGTFTLNEVKDDSLELRRTLRDANINAEKVNKDHILNLFPQCAYPGESVQPTARYGHAPLSALLRRWLLAPLMKLADRIRK